MGLVNVDVDLLRTLLVVSEVRNFTAAGERLMRSQSAISLQVKRLEEIVGQQLFERGKGKEITLTRSGEVIRSYAVEILKLNDALVREVRTGQEVRVLRIGTPDDYAQLILPKVLAEFSRENCNTELQIVTDLSPKLSDMVEAGDLDLVFVTRNTEIDGINLLNEKLSWVAAPQAEVVREDPLPLALFPEGCGVRDIAIRALEQAGRRWRIAYCSNQFSPLKTAITEHRAVGVLPSRAVPGDLMRVGEEYGLPELKNSELVMKMNEQAPESTVRLATRLVHAFQATAPIGRFQGQAPVSLSKPA